MVRKVKGFLSAGKTRNMVLTNQPRLYFTSTKESDGKDGLYRSDILLFSDLTVSSRKQGVLDIVCPISGKTMQYQTEKAKQWVAHIEKVLLEKEFENPMM